jgi:tetratricopeptide (TPR) repeat protein
VQEYPRLSYFIDDKELAENIGDLWDKLGFQGQSVPGSDFRTVLHYLRKGLARNFLFLIQYQKRVDGSSLISLLNELRIREPYKGFKNIIPVFFASITSARERELLRLLSVYEIQFVIFLPPNAPVGTKIEYLINELYQFQEKVVKGLFPERAEPSSLTPEVKERTGVIAQYKKLLDQGDELMETDPRKAIELFTRAIELKPDFNALMKRGDAYFKIREYLLALRDYRDANRLERQQPDPYSKISICCFNLVKESARTGDKEGAKKWFSLGSQTLKAARNLIQRRGKQKDRYLTSSLNQSCKFILSAMAAADFRGLGLEAEEEEIRDLTSEILFNSKEVDFLNPDLDVNARIDYAILLTRKRHYQEAETIFRELIEDDPKNVGPAFNNFAVELRKNGEYEKAFQTYMELLKYEIPDRDIVTRNLVTAGRRFALTLRDRGLYEEAVRSYKNMLIYSEGQEGKEWILCDLASTYMALKDRSQASTRLLEAVYVNPELVRSPEFLAYKDLMELKQDIINRLSASFFPEGNPPFPAS